MINFKEMDRLAPTVQEHIRKVKDNGGLNNELVTELVEYFRGREATAFIMFIDGFPADMIFDGDDSKPLWKELGRKILSKRGAGYVEATMELWGETAFGPKEEGISFMNRIHEKSKGWKC